MMSRQCCINHYHKSNFADGYILSLLKGNQAELEDKMKAYFSHHPIMLWGIVFVGVPIGILLAVGLTTIVFGLILLGITSFM